MKKLKLTAILFSILVLVLFTAKTSSAYAAEDIPIKVNEPVTGSMTASYDKKTYQLNLEKDTNILLYLEHENLTKGSQSWTTEIYDADGASLTKFTVNTDVKGGSSQPLYLAAGNYSIIVSMGYFWNTETYTLTVKGEENNGQYEAEGNAATPLSPNKPIIGNLHSKTDQDAYTLNLDTPSKVVLNFKHADGGSTSAQWYIKLWNEEGYEIYDLDSRENNVSVDSINLYLPAGHYTIWVSSGYFSSNIDYTLTAKAEANKGQFEIEDGKPTAIKVNKEITGNFINTADSDIFTFKLTKASRVNVNLKHQKLNNSANWIVGIYDKNDTKLTSFESGQSAISMNSINLYLPAGQYTIKITHGYFYSSTDYTFKVTQTANTGKYEINGKTNSLVTGAAVTGNISTEDNIDKYAFSLSKKKTISLNFKHANLENSSTYWIIQIYDSKKNLLHKFTSKGNEAAKTFKMTLPKGKYSITVSNNGRYYWSNADYTIKYTAK